MGFVMAKIASVLTRFLRKPSESSGDARRGGRGIARHDVGLKVLYFIEVPKLAGPHVQMVRVAEALHHCMDLEIIIPNGNNDLFQKLCDDNGLSYTFWPISHLTKEFWPLLVYIVRSPLEIISLTWHVRKTQPDLIHAWGGAWQFKAAIVARLSGVPLIWLLNDTQMPGYIRRLFRLAARRCGAFIFASRSTRDYYGKLIPREAQTAVIQSMVDLKAFDPAGIYPGDEALIDSWKGEFVVGLVANINPVKGIDTFIRVAARARAEGRVCRFVIVGPVYRRQQSLNDELVALAERLGADNVSFVGGRKDVRPLLRRFDTYLCCSLTESSPVSVWEALAMGRPVVSTPVGDVPYFVKDGETGFIAPVGDDNMLWQSVKRLMDDPVLAQQIGVRARQAAQAFGRKQIGDQTLSFYRKILGANGHFVQDDPAECEVSSAPQQEGTA